MNKINDYHRKKSSLDSLDATSLYSDYGVRNCPYTRSGRGTTYELKLWIDDDGCPPDGMWLYAAIEEYWPKIRELMKKIGSIDVLVAKGEAAKEAGDFLGSI